MNRPDQGEFVSVDRHLAAVDFSCCLFHGRCAHVPPKSPRLFIWLLLAVIEKERFLFAPRSCITVSGSCFRANDYRARASGPVNEKRPGGGRDRIKTIMAEKMSIITTGN